MSDETQVMTQDAEDAALAAPPDDQNPAIIEAHKTFVVDREATLALAEKYGMTLVGRKDASAE